MTLTPEELKICQALHLIRFYPREFHATVLDDISSFAGPLDRAGRLRWLIATARRAMGDGWRDELRGLWCTRFKPADGIEADCALAGHTPAEIESENLTREIAAPEVKLLPSAPEVKLLPSGEELRPSELPDLAYFANQKKILREEKYEPPEWLKNL